MLKKVFIGIGVFLLLLIITVVAVPFLFKDKINAKVKEAINKQLNAKVDYGDFSLSLIRSFPDFTVSLDDLSVVGVDEFKGDTLAYIKNLNVTVDIMTVIKGEKYKILALNVIEPTIHAKVNYKEEPNWDVAKPDESPSKSSDFAIEIKKVKIEKGEITYDDKAGNASAIIHNLNFEGSGDVTSNLYDLVTKTSIEELTYKSGAVAYLNKAKLDADMNLSVDNLNSKYTFKENTITVNDLGLQFDGYVAMPNETTNLDVKFKSKKTEFKSLLSLIPAVYQKDFDKIKTSGSLALEGDIKGSYKDSTSYPAFNLKLDVNNAMFQYPSLPVAVKNININTRVSKPQGSLDLAVINISKLHFDAGTDPVNATILIKTPVSNPDVTANINGQLNLGNVPKLYPMEDVKTISGLLKLALNFKARMSDIDNKNYAAIQAAGNAKITNLVYDSKSTPMAIRVPDMQMTFNPKNVTLNNLSAVLGKSDINAKGTLDNFMGYFMGKGDLVGNLELRSGVFDANQWLQKDNTTTAGGSTTGAKPVPDTANTQYFKVPPHIDFTANAQFGKIYYDKMVLENVKGDVIIRDEAINLNNLFANLLGGNATLNVKYNTKATDHPDVTFNYDINNLDIQQTYKAVDLAGKMAPIIKQIQGNFSSDLKGSGKLKPDMSVDYASLMGDGRVEIPYAKVLDLPVLGEIGKVAKIPALQNIELKNAWTVLKFKNGRVAVDPTDIKFGNGYNLHFLGSNGFDQTIDYDMTLDVPSKELGGAATLAQSYLSKIPGLNATMPATFGFVFKVTGTASKPVVKLSKVVPGAAGAGGGTNPVTDIKKQAQDEIQKQKQAAEQQAKDAANRAKLEAEQKAKEAAARAKKEAEEKLKKVLKFPK